MKPELECASCLMTWLVERVAVSGRNNDCFDVVRSVSGMIRDKFYPSANIGSMANKSIEIAGRLITESAEHFQTIKTGNNQLAQRTLPVARNFVDNAETTEIGFHRACVLAAAGNVAPIGLPSGSFAFDEVENILKSENTFPVSREDIDNAVQGSSHVLYLTDNSGEIGFDSLVLAKLKEMGKTITLVVKDGHFFEDATLDDVSVFGLESIVDRVLTVEGFFVPDEISAPLQEAFEESDLVVCKGTGNFEGLADETHGKNTIFMLKIKCGPIARKLGMEIGSFVVKLDP